MKRIISLLLLVLCVAGVQAKDFTKEQLQLRLNIVRYLSQQGLKPNIDEDGDVKFEYEDETYYAIINDMWSDPFLVTLYRQYSYDEDEGYGRENVEKCISDAGVTKAVKLYCNDNAFTLRADILCQDATLFTETFQQLMKCMKNAKKRIINRVDSGLAELDLDGDPDGAFAQAKKYYDKDDYDKSFPMFKALADVGYSRAYGYLGLAYELGEGTDVDVELMVANYEKAIEKGESWCAYRLGSYYYNKKDYTKALNNYLKCATNGKGFCSNAYYEAGRMYEKGEGTTRNLQQSIVCYRKSAQHASTVECAARLALARLGETVDKPSDFTEATRTMLLGLSPKEMYDKGYDHEHGLKGQLISLPKAYAYYKAAADAGYTDAFAKMGEIYVSKYYPFHDKTKSDKYYQKALKIYKQKEKTSGNACYELGYMYQNGQGVKASPEQAKYYYKSGALLGNKNAAWRFGLICKEEMEYADAAKFFEQAAEAGQGMAMYELAKLYEDGMGVATSRENAIKWYRKCVHSNYSAESDARQALRRLGVSED